MRHTRHFIVSGRVQGVGFRAATREQACRLGVSGWVSNRSDGRVEVVAHGPGEALDALAAWLRRGPDAARVDDLEQAAAVAQPAPDSGFEIR